MIRYPDRSFYTSDNCKWKSAANVLEDCINGKNLSENCQYFYLNATFFTLLTVTYTLYIFSCVLLKYFKIKKPVQRYGILSCLLTFNFLSAFYHSMGFFGKTFVAAVDQKLKVYVKNESVPYLH